MVHNKQRKYRVDGLHKKVVNQRMKCISNMKIKKK